MALPCFLSKTYTIKTEAVAIMESVANTNVKVRMRSACNGIVPTVMFFKMLKYVVIKSSLCFWY